MGLFSKHRDAVYKSSDKCDQGKLIPAEIMKAKLVDIPPPVPHVNAVIGGAESSMQFGVWSGVDKINSRYE